MSGLCGWLGAADKGSNPVTILSDMAAGLLAVSGQANHAASATSCGLHVGGWARTWDLFRDGTIWAAIEGSPRWTADDIATVAAESGHAKALAIAFKRHGRDLFGELQGAWSLAVIDAATERALIAIDRMAVRPMSYTTPAGGGVVFGTTTDSVRAHPAVTVTISPQALFDYLFFTRTPAPSTVYNEIRKLLPGQYLWYEAGRAATATYWRIEYRDDSLADINALAEELRHVLRRAVARALDGVNAAEVGAVLSGGLDSSTLTGLLAEQVPAAGKAFSVGFEAEGFDELSFAREAARHFGIEHHACTVTPKDIIDFVPTMARIYDEPFANSSAVGVYFCARLARQHGVRVLLAGDGGDELFAGNTRYVWQKIFEAYGLIPGWLRRAVLERLIDGVPGGHAIPPIRKARSYVRRAKTPLPERLESYNPFLDFSPDQCFAPGLAKQIDQDHPINHLKEHFFEARATSTLERMMYLDLMTTIADDDLRKVTRTCDAAGVQARFPLLDDDVVDLAGHVPASMQIKRLRSRYFFKYAMRDFLPQATLTKKKQGFGLPFGVWLGTDRSLRDFAMGNLTALKGRHVFAPEFLDLLVEECRTGHASVHQQMVWALILLEQWFQSRA